MFSNKIATKKLEFGSRRGVYIDISELPDQPHPVSAETLNALDKYNLWYRTLCSILYNFVPTSGHPGGSVSSGHMVTSVIIETMDYNIGDPDQPDADLISYAAGHKALGLYAMWASRNEMVRVSHPDLLPGPDKQLRLEDMLGFRRNPVQDTPLFRKFNAKALDGHPTPQTPFLRLSTGPSGVGISSSFGMALGALDRYGRSAPTVHVIEGEGGMTPGRVSEASAAAATAQLRNLIVHVDWNQASIDSNRVCRDGDLPGEYVQWNPLEFFYLHDWNVIWVPDGFDYDMIIRAQQLAKEGINDQPTAIVYKTVKGWKYGIEGKKSHGAGHKFCSSEYYESLSEFETAFKTKFPRLADQKSPEEIEQLYFDTMLVLREIAEREKDMSGYVGKRIADSKKRLQKLGRKPAPDGARLSVLYNDESIDSCVIPDELKLQPNTSATLRGELGKTLGYLNNKTNGAFIGAAADLLGSTSVNKLAADFPAGLYNFVNNPKARLIAVGGICEDAMGAFMTGLSSFGYHIGVTASYAAFIAALEHIAARIHCISQQARHAFSGDPYKTFIMICAHAGLKTGEDGPTHADPQALQLLLENFPAGHAITLTPWDPQELWPLVVEGLKKRPSLLAPFVTRPNETVFDRKKCKLPPVTATVDGVYQFRNGNPDKKPYHGTIIIQGSAVANDFVAYVLPHLDDGNYNINVYYVSSAELFFLLPEDRQKAILPEERRREAMGITDFTMPTMYYWITSDIGRKHSLFAYSRGIYPGSGKAEKVLEEVGLNGPAQWAAIQKYIKDRESIS